MVEKISEKNRWNSQLENAALPVDYAKTSTTDAMAVNQRTISKPTCIIFKCSENKNVDTVESVMSFHAI